MAEDTQIAAKPLWPLVLAGLASLGWLLLAFAAMSPLFGMNLPPAFTQSALAAGVALNVGAPLAVFWLVAMRLRENFGVRRDQATLLVEQTRLSEIRLDEGSEALVRLESRLNDFTGQLTAMARPVERQHQALVASIAGLETAAQTLMDASQRSESAAVRIGAETPAATTAAERLTALLDASREALAGQIQEADALLAALNGRMADARQEAGAAAGEAEARIAAITAVVSTAQAAMQQPLDALNEGVDNALNRTTEALNSTRSGVHAQTNALLASVDQARTTLDHISGEAARIFAERLAGLDSTLGELQEKLDMQANSATAMVGKLVEDFERFDAQLASSTAQTGSSIEAVTAHIRGASEALDAMATPVETRNQSLVDLAGQVAALDANAASLFGAFDSRVPAIVPGLEDLGQRLARLHEEATALGTPIEAGADTIASAQSRLESAGTALEGAVTALGDRLSGAEASLAAITRTTEDEALAAASQLVDSFARIREIANQSAGTMRDTLAVIISDAEAALDKAGSDRAEAAFGAPIRTALTELGSVQERAASAAQAAAERVTQRLMTLTQTVAHVETHFDKRQTEIDIRNRSDIARRASTLISGLNEAAIDLTRLLALDIEDQSYDEWLAGDRSRFVRHLARSLDGDTGKAIARHLAHDPAFRVDATRYVEDFESLIGHVTADPKGRALASTLLASDPGKLYLALTQGSAS